MNVSTEPNAAETVFLGLAPFLRASIAGLDLRPTAQQMLAEAQQHHEDAPLWMNLSVAMQCIGQHDVGLSIQAAALELQRIYALPATRQPRTLRLLVLMAPGDIAANTPIDCLLENSTVDIVLYYVAPGDPLAQPIPEHDVLLVAISESDQHRDLLTSLAARLADWPQPVINAPQHIPKVGRDAASTLLHDAPGIVMPPTLRATRAALQALADGAPVAAQFVHCDYPLIVRPYDSQAGRDLARIEDAAQLAHYLTQVAAEDFFLSRFIDYRSADGQFRKFRIALIDGRAYACHMAVSAHWMVHYVNAGMYEDAAKRAEELRFMQDFAQFEQRHQNALQAIHQRTGLDYLLLDAAETQDGDLLLFEIDHTMVVHAMDSEEMFPHKQVQIAKVQAAFEAMLQQRVKVQHA